MFRLRYLLGGLVLFGSVLIGFVSKDDVGSPSVQEYYGTLESRIDLSIPISGAQRAMEEKLYTRLDLPAGSKVLDAGAGSGYVALYMAKKGLSVQAIDITPRHLVDARKNVKTHGLEDTVVVDFADYHNLSAFSDASFDGIYTMETFVHADDPARVLRNFFRLLKPGGVLVLHEADFSRNFETLQDFLRLSHCQNTLEQGRYENLILEVGFKDVSVEDLTNEVLPMWRLFGIMGYVPYQIFRIIGIQHRFVNVMGGVETWLNWGDLRYISVKAIKPSQ